MITLTKRIGRGDIIPAGWGVAYWEMTAMSAVIYPLPLNWIVAGVREAYFFLAQGPKYRQLMDFYELGRRAGESASYERGLREGQERAYKEIRQVLSKLRV